MGIKENRVQVGHTTSDQPQEIKDFTTRQGSSGPTNQISLLFAQQNGPRYFHIL